MENYRIYLSGGMSGLSLEEQKSWRDRVINAIKYGEYEINKSLIFFNPPDYYSPCDEEPQYKTEKEVMEFDLNQLRKSDLVIVNFNVPHSIGTAMEIMLAKELNVPIIGLNKDGYKLHPWLVECTTRMCDTMREMVDYVANFYLK